MSEQTIKCPKCGEEIELSAALTGGIRESLRLEVEAGTRKQEAELAKRQDELAGRERAIAKQTRELADEVNKRLAVEVEKVSKEQFAKAAGEVEAKTKSILAELAAKTEAVKAAEAKELAFLKEKKELEEKAGRLELEVERKLSEGRKKIIDEERVRVEEEQKLKIREKDDLVVSLKGQLEDMRRKMEQGSQERQGEMLEEELKELLERSFPYDKFEDVLKGKRGADIIQIVHGPSGKICGKILWESKNTKEYSKAWIEKLKKDQADAGAEVAILMTVAMPREVRDFDYHNDVWVTNYKCAIGLCTSLRHNLINVARERIVVAGQEDMKDFVYKYVTGPEFGRRIKRIAGAYVQMQADLESEKRSMLKIWKKREKQITVVIENAAEMRGEIEGLAGGKLLGGDGTFSLDSIADE